MLKYELDIENPDGFKEKYGIKAFPTFVFLNGDGEEVARMLGGARDPKGFIRRVTEATAPENSFKAREERLKKDPSYAMDHIAFLKDNYMEKEADEALASVFKNRSVEQNFDEKSLKYYDENIRDINSPIIQYMLNNGAEVAGVMGKDKYDEFITKKANTFLMFNSGGRNFKPETLDNALAEMGKTKALQTAFYQFVVEGKDAILAKDFKSTVKIATKYVKKADSDSRMKILNTVNPLAMGDKRQLLDENKSDLLKFLANCAKSEKDPKLKEIYQSRIKAIENPESVKKDGSVPMMLMQ